MKKYIIYIGEMEFPSKNAAAQRVLGVAGLLKKMGFITILSGLNKDLRDENILKSQKDVLGYRGYEFPYPSAVSDWAKFICRIDYIYALIMRYGPQNIHAVIVYNYPGIAMARLIRLCKQFDIRFVSDCTEWYGISNRRFPANVIKQFDTFLRMRVLNGRVKNIICASDYLEAYYSKKCCHTVNIPSLVDHSNFKWANRRSKYKPNKPRSFVYAGSPGISSEKDRLDWLIKVFHKIKFDNIPFIFNIIGITKDSYLNIYPEHYSLIQDLENDIIFHGRLAHDVTIEIIKKADFSLFFRGINRVTSAGFPTKVAESFACGTPVITNRTSNIASYIIDGRTGYIAEGSSEANLHATLLQAFNNNDKELEGMHSFCLTKNPLDMSNFIKDLKIFMDNLL